MQMLVLKLECLHGFARIVACVWRGLTFVKDSWLLNYLGFYRDRDRSMTMGFACLLVWHFARHSTTRLASLKAVWWAVKFADWLVLVGLVTNRNWLSLVENPGYRCFGCHWRTSERPPCLLDLVFCVLRSIGPFRVILYYNRISCFCTLGMVRQLKMVWVTHNRCLSWYKVLSIDLTRTLVWIRWHTTSCSPLLWWTLSVRSQESSGLLGLELSALDLDRWLDPLNLLHHTIIIGVDLQRLVIDINWLRHAVSRSAHQIIVLGVCHYWGQNSVPFTLLLFALVWLDLIYFVLGQLQVSLANDVYLLKLFISFCDASCSVVCWKLMRVVVTFINYNF